MWKIVCEGVVILSWLDVFITKNGIVAPANGQAPFGVGTSDSAGPVIAKD